MPLKLTVCGLPVALSVMASDALRAPAAEGVKVTLIVQLAPAATLAPQLLVWAKSTEFAPPSAMLEMLSEALPVLESVTVCAALVEPIFSWPNARLVAERLTMGAAGGGGLLPPPPPPQAAQIPTTSMAVANAKPARRRSLARLASIAKASNPAKNQGNPTGRRRPAGSWRPRAEDVVPGGGEGLAPRIPARLRRDSLLSCRRAAPWNDPSAGRLAWPLSIPPGRALGCRAGRVAPAGAVVLTVSVAVGGDAAVTLTEEGEIAQVTPGAEAPQVKLTEPLKP